jgi:endonuclease/exonuclease/phosphatase family metal-dependent hydrolase
MKKIYHVCLIMLMLVMLCLPAWAQVSLQSINVPYTQLFDSLASTGTANDVSTLPHGWTFVESGTNANGTYAAGTGSSNAGNTYSFGLDVSDRALGGLLSGSLTTTLGAGFTNHTGAIITAIVVSYRGEQWRLGATGRADRLDFQYSLNAASLASGDWIDVNDLDFTSPITSGTAGLLNGNDAANQTDISFSISGLTIQPGQSFYLRWLDFNATGADDGLAIDNFALTPQGIPSTLPSIVLTPASLAFGDVTINSSDTLSYSVKGSNLSEPISIIGFDPVFTLSTDRINFTSSVSLPDSGGVVYVRFAPVSPLTSSDSIQLTSSGVLKQFPVRGHGFDQASSIIPISQARQQSIGSKVTVAGRITVGKELGNPVYMQDASGGIPVFDYSLMQHVSIGDSVIVTGPVGVFNDQVQISGNGIFFTVADTLPRIVKPVIISPDQLPAYEGFLVSIENVTLVNKNFIFYPQSTEVISANGVNADLRIDGDTNIPGLAKPQGTFTATGVVGRFRTAVQLLPRFQQDIPGAILPSTPSDSIAANLTFDVVNWNLEFFGAKSQDYRGEEFGPADEALQLQNVKRIMLSVHADVFAVQEVSNDSLFTELVSQLPGYRSVCSARYSYSFDGPSNEFPPQKVCFIYDTLIVKVLDNRPLFEELYDAVRQGNSSGLPGYPTGDGSSFYSSGRLPFKLTANVTIQGVTEKISFINIHAKSGATAADRSRRLYDITVLKDSLDAKYTDEKFIILGDLNDDLDKSIATGLSSPYQGFVSDSLRYESITKALSDAGARSTISFSDMIDHQIISNELSAAYLNESARVITPFSLIPAYAATTSDHLAVLSRFKFQETEINFVEADITLPEGVSTHRFTVRLDKAFSQPKTITIAVQGSATAGQDFNTTPATQNGLLTLVIPADSMTASFTVNLLQDKKDEVNETIEFALLPATGIIGGAQGRLIITVEDDDVPFVQFSSVFGSGKEGLGELPVTLSLSTPPATDQTLTIATLNGFGVTADDYSTAPAVAQNKITVQVAAGSTQANVMITPLTDTRRELPELITFYLDDTSDGLLIGQPRLFIFTLLDGGKRNPDFSVYPNPTTGPVTLRAIGVTESENIYAELRSPWGTSLFAGHGTLQQLSEIISQRVQSDRRGIYTVKLILDGESYILRILKI